MDYYIIALICIFELKHLNKSEAPNPQRKNAIEQIKGIVFALVLFSIYY